MRTIKAARSTLWVALGVALLAAAGPVRAEDGVVRVGIITDMSGQYADGTSLCCWVPVAGVVLSPGKAALSRLVTEGGKVHSG